MRGSWARERARLFAVGAEPAGPATGGGRAALVGRDLHRRRPVRRRLARLGLPFLLAAVAGALLLASLRVAILRVRYDLAAALTQELELIDRRNAAAVEMRELRHPARLQRLARERGLVRPEHVIELGRPARDP